MHSQNTIKRSTIISIEQLPEQKLQDVWQYIQFLLYQQQREQESFHDAETPSSDETSDVVPRVRGALHHYANPELIPEEQFAWARAAKEKHAIR